MCEFKLEFLSFIKKKKKKKNRDGFLWNTMIRGFVKTSQKEKDFEFYKRTQEITLIASKSKLEC